MRNLKCNHSLPLYSVIILLSMTSLMCNLGGPTTAIVTATPGPSATPSPAPVTHPGDYGDAPDGDRNQDTGYYAPTGGPFFFTYSSAGIAANFPTIYDDPIPGPFTQDVDEFWIGPLFGGSSSMDIPSIEDDADDPFDPDGIPNLQLQGGGADCDRENGSHNPAATGCAPMPAYSMPMNARLMIMFGYPPLGVWITSVTASKNMGYNGPIYWNLLFDLNQDGSWDGANEWIAQDIVVHLAPGETQTLISPAFRFPTSGTPWGRLNFPIWVRSMVTSESVSTALGSSNWDGRGPQGGFDVGEVEDYFVEWRPIGQRFPNQEPQQAGGCGPDDMAALQALPQSNISLGETITLMPGDTDSIQVLAASDDGGTAIDAGVLELVLSGRVPLDVPGWNLQVEVDAEQDLAIQPVEVPLDATMPQLIFLPQFREEDECLGTGEVIIQSGLRSVIDLIKPEERGLSTFGLWLFETVVKEDDEVHHPFIMMLKVLKVIARPGSIVFESDPPWVNVSGELAEDGSFNAQGRGVVAGFHDIAVTFEGAITDAGLQGDYIMGSEGGLPGGKSITYGITGTYQGDEEPVEGPVAPKLADGIPQAIQSFTAIFNQAFVDQNPQDLYDLLHPAVLDLYGTAACQIYLQSIVGIPTRIDYLDAQRVDAWQWERDGALIPVKSAYAVQVTFTGQDQITEQELHLALPGDDSVRWFTDCGDPLE